MKHPINVLLIVAHGTRFHGGIPDKPKIEINRHQGTRVVLPTMLGQGFAVDEILYLATKDLAYEYMPSGNASTACVKDVIFFPIGFRTKRSPRSYEQRRSSQAPATIWQILEIQLAVVRIHRRLKRADSVEALYKLVSAGTICRHIDKANPSGICAFQVFALVANLGLPRIRSGPVGGRDHAQQTIASLIRISRN